MKKETKNQPGIATTLKNLGTTYHLQKNYPKAIEYCESALQLAEEIGYLSIINEAAESLYESI